ncbi:MAG: radical SAM protein [Sedimentisphaerales bacterium]|nr:radical SAM protein [Sedimentisphaerales bacterium]
MAGALIDAGYEVRQFDWLVAGRSEDLLGQAVGEFAPDAVAVSIRNVDRIDSTAEFADTWELKEAQSVVTSLRRFTTVPVVIGGPAVSTMPQEVRRYVGADMAVPGEGEHAIVAALAAVIEGRPLPAVWPMASERLCGEYQHSPSFDPELVAHYWDKSGVIGLQTKRGCPYHCCYCTYPDLEGTTFRPRPVEAVIADMERLKRDFHVDTLFLVDSVFNDPRGKYLYLVEALAARNLGVKWACYMSPRGLTREALMLCKRAGLYAVELGTDATTETTLRGMGKPFRWEEVERTNQMLAQTGIACAHFVIFGGPGETPETIREGLDNIARLEHCVVFGFSGVRIYPGTRLHQHAIAEHFLQETDSLFEPVYYVSSAVDKAWMEQQVTESWAGRRDRIFPPHEGQRAAAILRSFGWKGLLWERMIRFPSAVA